MRGFAGTALGVCLYRVHEDFLSGLQISLCIRVILAVVSFVLVLSVAIETICKGQTVWDFVCIPIFCIVIESSWLVGSNVHFESKLFALMDTLTFPMYCMQVTVFAYGGLWAINNRWFVPIDMALSILLILLFRVTKEAICSSCKLRGGVKQVISLS